MKAGIRTWLQIEDADKLNITIKPTLDFEGNAIKNKVWYWGDASELQQLYEQIAEESEADTQKFWAAKASKGLEIRKIHTGLPSMIVDTIANVTLIDLGNIDFKNAADADLWQQIAQENDFKHLLDRAVKEALYIGDGAFKISYSEKVSKLPIIEFFGGDRVDYKIERGRLQAVKFKTIYQNKNKSQKYVLVEEYGKGYIKYKLVDKDNKEVPLETLEETENLKDVAFAGAVADENGEIVEVGSYSMAVPLKFYNSSKWQGRGQSILDRKCDSFDAFDEAFSQWMDAIRAGRTKTYIPETLIPRGSQGELLKPNAFDNRFIKVAADMSEGAKNGIETDAAAIQHESYLQTYITALDLCLQGIISPSTLGIDVKKLDNAESQREKEKATLYTRNTIIDVLLEDIPMLVNAAIKSYNEMNNLEAADVELALSFGEYANPSFESQVETIGKAKQQGIMSIEAAVEELYGDTKDDEWKEEEVKRLKEEAGIVEMDEPALNGADNFGF